jgi:DNA-binding transcriptional MerR regulator
MQDLFFTSKEAAEISGCTLRQLQYWREKEIVLPTIGSTGTGRSVYYSSKEVAELLVMEHCLRSGLNFDMAAAALDLLKERSPNLIETVSRPWLFSWNDQEDGFEMIDFDEQRAIEWLRANRVVIPFCLKKLPLLQTSRSVSAAINR